MQNRQIKAALCQKSDFECPQKRCVQDGHSTYFFCFFFKIFFHSDVIGANGKYVALLFFVRKGFQFFGIGKARNGICDGFAVLLKFAKFKINFLLRGRCACRYVCFLSVIVAAQPCFCALCKLSDNAVFVLYVAHVLSPFAHISTLRPKGKARAKTSQNTALFVFFPAVFFANFRANNRQNRQPRNISENTEKRRIATHEKFDAANKASANYCGCKQVQKRALEKSGFFGV